MEYSKYVVALLLSLLLVQTSGQDIPVYTLEPPTTITPEPEEPETTTPQPATEEPTTPQPTTPLSTFPPPRPTTTTTVRPVEPNDPYQCCLVLKSYWMLYGYKTCCFLCCKTYFGHKCKPVQSHFCYNGY